MALHPHVGVGAKEEEPVNVARCKNLNGHAKLVSNSAAVVIGEPHGYEERKVAQHQQLAEAWFS